MINLNWSFPPTALTFKWSLMISTVARTPSSISIQTQLANGVLTITTLRIGIEVSPHLKVSTFTAESATRRGVVLPQIPPHRLNCHLYECMVNSNAMRALCRLALTCSEYARRAPGKKLLYNLEYGGPKIFSHQYPTPTPAFMSFQKGSAQ